MSDSNEFLIDKILQTITAENIDDRLLFYSSLLEQLMNKKECYSINIKPRACKKKMKKIRMQFLEWVSDEDSSSDYIPSEIDSDSDDDC